MAGLLAAGREPRRPPFVAVTPQGTLLSLMDALLSFQEDTGALQFRREFPEVRLKAVVDSVPALMGPFPPYRARQEGGATVAGQARLARRADGLILIAPYTGDDNDDGALVVRQRGLLAGAWSDPLPVTKTAVAYLLILNGVRDAALSIEYQDNDGVEGAGSQTLYLVQTNLPLVFRP